MQCREAKQLRFAEASGALPDRRRNALRAHLACCPDCAEESRMDGWIERDLASLRVDLPFDLDVSGRVLATIGPLGPPRAERPSLRLFGWAAAAAAAAALIALGGLSSLLAGRGEAIDQAAGLGRALWGTVAALLRPVGGFLMTVLATVDSLLETLAATPGLATASHTAGWSLLAGWILVLSTAAWFVGRDLLRGRPWSVGKES